MNKEDSYKTFTGISSGVALAATGIAAFTPIAPIAAGIFIGTAVLGSGIATFSYYKSLEEHRKKEK